MSVVWPAQNTTLGIDETNNGSYTLIGGITSLDNLAGGTVAQAKTTVLVSNAHTYRGTIADPAEFTAELWFDPTDPVHIFLFHLMQAPWTGPNNYKSVYNTTNSNTSICSANISEFNGPNAGDVEENLAASITWKITGLMNANGTLH